MELINEVATLIQSVGFPIAVACMLLWLMTKFVSEMKTNMENMVKVLDEMHNVLHENTVILERLSNTITTMEDTKNAQTQ